MVLLEQDPNEVNWIIEYLYTGKGLPNTTESTWNCTDEECELVPEVRAKSSLRLLTLADYFDIPSLKTDIVISLETAFDKIARRIQGKQACFLTRPKLFFTDFQMEDFFYVAGKPYDCNLATFSSLQRPVKEFIQRTRFIVGQDARFQDRLKEIPGLAVDMIQLMMRSGTGVAKSLVVTATPAECSKCNQKCSFFKDTWLDNTGTREASMILRGHCEMCSKH